MKKSCESAIGERVSLTMNREQARVVERACELLACLNVGQFNIITEMLMDSRRGMDDYCWRRDMAKELFNLAALSIFGEEMYGQPNLPEKNAEHERAWLIYTTLRHARSWHDHPDGGYTVNLDPPLPTGEYMPKCEITKEGSV